MRPPDPKSYTINRCDLKIEVRNSKTQTQKSGSGRSKLASGAGNGQAASRVPVSPGRIRASHPITKSGGRPTGINWLELTKIDYLSEKGESPL